MNLQKSLDPVAAALGTDPITLALCIGILAGFILAKIFKLSGNKAHGHSPNIAGNARMAPAPQRAMSLTGGSISLATNKASVEMDLAFCTELKRLLKQGNKIQAIKAFREKTNTDLSSAKALVELFESQMDRFPDLP